MFCSLTHPETAKILLTLFLADTYQSCGEVTSRGISCQLSSVCGALLVLLQVCDTIVCMFTFSGDASKAFVDHFVSGCKIRTATSTSVLTCVCIATDLAGRSCRQDHMGHVSYHQGSSRPHGAPKPFSRYFKPF